MLYVCVYLPVACLLLPLTALKQTSKDKQNALVRTMKNITQNYIIDSTLADRAQQKNSNQKENSGGKWRAYLNVPVCLFFSFFIFICLPVYLFTHLFIIVCFVSFWGFFFHQFVT